MISYGDEDYVCIRAKVLNFRANPGGTVAIESLGRPTCVHLLPSGVVQNFDTAFFEYRDKWRIYVLKDYCERHKLERKFA